MRLTCRKVILHSELLHYLQQHLLPLGIDENRPIKIQHPTLTIPNVFRFICYFPCLYVYIFNTDNQFVSVPDPPIIKPVYKKIIVKDEDKEIVSKLLLLLILLLFC